MTGKAQGGRCAFTQTCFQTGVDTACTPTVVEGSEAEPFPMDEAHGYRVKHNSVWDGSTVDAYTGLCSRGAIPDEEGRCFVDFPTPRGLSPIAPIICPRYTDNGCCTWQQNYALYQNLQTLVDSFGSTTGCLACAVNLVDFWCAVICSPEQGDFVTIHDPAYAQRADDLTGGSSLVLQADVRVDPAYACRIYNSCKRVAIVGETTAMQSGLGLLKYQMQTGAVGHGEYFFLSFDNGTSLATPKPSREDTPTHVLEHHNNQEGDPDTLIDEPGDPTQVIDLNLAPQLEQVRQAGNLGLLLESGKDGGLSEMDASFEAPRHGSEGMVEAFSSDVDGNMEGVRVPDTVAKQLPEIGLGSEDTTSLSWLSLETLACHSFFYPGNDTVPFVYPPPQVELMGCGCDYCSSACGGGASVIDVDVSKQRPIPVLDGFNAPLVGGVYAAILSLSVILLLWRCRSRRHQLGTPL
ncbi:unnamed protein product [Choristocarpus tenellus]